MMPILEVVQVDVFNLLFLVGIGLEAISEVPMP